jgi:hypothetical protein
MPNRAQRIRQSMGLGNWRGEPALETAGFMDGRLKCQSGKKSFAAI